MRRVAGGQVLHVVSYHKYSEEQRMQPINITNII